MRGYTRYIFLAVLAGMILYSCKKAYMPADVAENANLLVVEGVINAGGDSTIIKLSRTIKLTGGTGINAQAGAQVTVEEENGGSFSLQEKPNGLYVAAALNIDNTKKYRLRIKTGAKEYLSDFVEVKITPPIDKVDFNIKSNALDVNVNAHDDGGNTRYYRWAFDETWEFNANFFSPNKSNGEKVVPRDLVNDNIYHCWANNSSTSILLGSTAKLSQDVVKDHTVLTIPGEAERLSIKYSILVKQYAMTKQEFEFWEIMKKNTEQLGTIFDPQPSQVKGNIHCVTDPAEVVIGYLGVCTVVQKRNYIDKSKLMQFSTKRFYTDCTADSVLFERIQGNAIIHEEDIYFNRNYILIPLDAITTPFGDVIGHMGTAPRCADCTLRGTKNKPAFWE